MSRILLCLAAFVLLIQPAVPAARASGADEPALAASRAKPAADQSPSRTVETNAEAAALIDVASGRILFSKAGDKRMRIASTTKIMTAIIAIEHGHLADKVTVSKLAFGKEGSSIYLKLGEEMSLSDLLYGLMLRSGNDAATAIAEYVGGSQEGFVYLMNRKAEEIGMTRSHFANPSGLDASDHYSTADDMARLAAYALKNPIFREVVKTKSKQVSREGEPWDTVWTNKNKMLSLYPGSDGVKTGFTQLSRRCLVSSATRDGQQLAAVTLNDGSDWADHSRMLDYGFKNYPLQIAVKKGEPLRGGFTAADDFVYPFGKGEREAVERRLVLNKPKSVDYRLGDPGELELRLAGTVIGKVPLALRRESGSKAAPEERLNGAKSSVGEQTAFASASAAAEAAEEQTGWLHRWTLSLAAVLRSLIPGARGE